MFAIGAKFPIMHSNEIYDCVCTPPIGSSDSILDWAKYSKSVCLVSDLTCQKSLKSVRFNIFLPLSRH